MESWVNISKGLVPQKFDSRWVDWGASTFSDAGICRSHGESQKTRLWTQEFLPFQPLHNSRVGCCLAPPPRVLPLRAWETSAGELLCSLYFTNKWVCLKMGYSQNWLVVSTHLKNISQFGMIIPNMWKNKSHVPNHQPEKNYCNSSDIWQNEHHQKPVDPAVRPDFGHKEARFLGWANIWTPIHLNNISQIQEIDMAKHISTHQCLSQSVRWSISWPWYYQTMRRMICNATNKIAPHFLKSHFRRYISLLFFMVSQVLDQRFTRTVFTKSP